MSFFTATALSGLPTHDTATSRAIVPRLTAQIYRYDPINKGIRTMVDSLGHPNGLCFSPDERTVYVTDTDWLHGSGMSNHTRASTIYTYDMVIVQNEPFMTKRRLFASADLSIPDSIKCDMEGNVYSGCGDGVNVSPPRGVLLGRIRVQGGTANFCFGRRGEVFILNESRLWRAQLGDHVRGALLGM